MGETQIKRQTIEEHTEGNPLIVEDYPYGFRLRTKARYWIDTSKNKGQRVGFQTLNPKTNLWNKVKYSTYSDLRVLYINLENSHIENEGLSFEYDGLEELNKFLDNFEKVLTPYQKERILYLKAILETRKYVKITIHENPTEEEQKRIDENDKKAKGYLRQVFKVKLAEQLSKA